MSTESADRRRGDRVTELWAYLAVDPSDDCEGIIGTRIGDIWMPLVGADRARMHSLASVAAGVAAIEKCQVRLVRFTERTVMETIGIEV